MRKGAEKFAFSMNLLLPVILYSVWHKMTLQNDVFYGYCVSNVRKNPDFSHNL